MEIGKIPNDILKEIVLNKIKYKRKEVLVRPSIGEDCSVVDFGDEVCVLSSDPITGAANEVGRLAVHVSCNDVASCGIEPLGLMVTILAPPDTSKEDLSIIMSQLSETAASLKVDIMGGHTEITDAVNRVVIMSTAIGKAPKGKVVTTAGAKAGDKIVMTKTAGLEGTAIIAFEREKELLNVLGREIVDNAKKFMDSISVVKEGVIAGAFGVSAMHDVTEGGILGAAWELAEASGKGFRIEKNLIPIKEETLKITAFYKIDPMKLISSGCMVIACLNGDELVEELRKQGIQASVIGEITEEKDKLLFTENERVYIGQPASDELYKVIGKD
ncbi:MAG: AIR synthase family protein [Clostridia bacterium]|nr:AIR synthase family protein [Clostridia bacterium]